MVGTDIENKINNYWAEKCKILDIVQQKELDEIIEELANKRLINPTEDSPIRAFGMAG